MCTGKLLTQAHLEIKIKDIIMNTIEVKGGMDELNTANFIAALAIKHDVKPENIMIGFAHGDKKELYVWEWDAGKSMHDQFKTLEIIYL